MTFSSGAQRWSTLRDRAEPFEIFLIKQQIVRTGLSGRIDATRSSCGDLSDAAGGAHMDDVDGAPCLFSKEESASNRLDLGNRRPRGQVVASSGMPRRDGLGRQS